MVYSKKKLVGVSMLHIDNELCTDKDKIKNHVVDFYYDLFNNDLPRDSSAFQIINKVIPSSVLEDNSVALTCIPTSEEVKNTISNMSTSSAPSSDGFNGAFYQCRCGC